MKTALFSLYNTDCAVEFAARLISAGWRIVASRETVKLLRIVGMPVVDVADFTKVKADYGFPPTLHPKIEYSLTAESARQRIDLVYVVNYPISRGNDVGGRTLLALAAKGKRIAVNNVADMSEVVSNIEKYGEVSRDLKNKLADKVNEELARHFFSLIKDRKNSALICGEHVCRLANGENPYQIPADFFTLGLHDGLALPDFKLLAGEPPCFTNMADADALLQAFCLCAQGFKKNTFRIPFICAAAKHGNVCGLAADWKDPAVAIEKALFADPRAIWGGEAIVNFSLNSDLAAKLLKSIKREKCLGNSAWMLDVIMAPAFDRRALEILGKRKQRKLLANPALRAGRLNPADFVYRFVRGGFLRQPPGNHVLDLRQSLLVGEKLSKTQIDDLTIAWSAAFGSFMGGNEVALAGDMALISCGGGPSTVEAAQIALYKAKLLNFDINGAVFAADAFFPFTDAPEVLVKAGVVAGIVPGGGMAFEKVKQFFAGKKTKMVYLPENYRGFCRH